MNEIRISAKNLGALAMPDFCPRCFWVKSNIKKLPWQIFPGIFSSIDSYTKKTVHNYFDTHGHAPPWLPEAKDAKRYLKCLWHTKFFRKDPVTGITVSGTEDDLFEFDDNSRMIVDYKTAKFTKNADKLLPIYDTQLNGYAWIEEGFGHEVRPELPLYYCQPVTDPDIKRIEDAGFNMGFSVHTVIVKKDTAKIPELLQRAHGILTGDIPPRGVECKDCENLDMIIDAWE